MTAGIMPHVKAGIRRIVKAPKGFPMEALSSDTSTHLTANEHYRISADRHARFFMGMDPMM